MQIETKISFVREETVFIYGPEKVTLGVIAYNDVNMAVQHVYDPQKNLIANIFWYKDPTDNTISAEGFEVYNNEYQAKYGLFTRAALEQQNIEYRSVE